MDEPNLPIILKCPHCEEFVLIQKLNCKIFRHGVHIKNNKQIDSHASKDLCDYYVKHKLIYGCGKPFQIYKNNDNEYCTMECDYI
jgi:hypothetical protein